MKNKRWKVIVPAVLLILALLYFTVIRKYMEWANVQALEDYAREQFASQDLEDYVRRCARASGISDLRAEAEIYSWYDSYPTFYDPETRTLQAECRLTFYSDSIDRCYTQSWNSLSARSACLMVEKLYRSYKTQAFKYTGPKGTVNVALPGNASRDTLTLYSGAGHRYEVWVTDSHVSLQIDDETLVVKDRGQPYTGTSGGSSSGSGKSSGNNSTKYRGGSSSRKSGSSYAGDPIDPDDYDIEAYYDDNRDVYDDYDEAWEGFLDDEDAWDDY